MDHSNRDAKRAVADLVDQLGPWRDEIAQMAAKAARPYYSADHALMLRRCEAIRKAIQQVRAELLVGLLEAPAAVQSHGRVADAEKALDNLEMSLTELERRLEQVS